MDELPRDEVIRIHRMLTTDEEKRDRRSYAYAYDIMASQCVVQFSIWPLPNGDVVRVLVREVDYESLPWEDQNEVEKGMIFEDQRRFVAGHVGEGKQMLCEARDYQPCLQAQCPLFRTPGSKGGGEFGICAEFKLVFPARNT